MKKKSYFEPEMNICRFIFAQDQLVTASQGVPDVPEETLDEDVDIDD